MPGRRTVGHEAPWGVARVLHGELAIPRNRSGAARVLCPAVPRLRPRYGGPHARRWRPHAARAVVPAGAHRCCPVGEFDLADWAQQIRPVGPRHGQRLDIDRGKDRVSQTGVRQIFPEQVASLRPVEQVMVGIDNRDTGIDDRLVTPFKPLVHVCSVLVGWPSGLDCRCVLGITDRCRSETSCCSRAITAIITTRSCDDARNAHRPTMGGMTEEPGSAPCRGSG